MTLEEMMPLAQKGIKMTHLYFAPQEWLTIHKNKIIWWNEESENLNKYITDKHHVDWVKDGWEEYKES